MKFELLGLFLIGAFGTAAWSYPMPFDQMALLPEDNLRIVNTDGAFRNLDDMYTVSNRKEEIREENTSEIFMNKLKEVYNLDDYGRPQKVKETAYLLVKTLKHRDKRYINYLTLCHFKICNMGRKRNPRYKSLIEDDSNDALP